MATDSGPEPESELPQASLGDGPGGTDPQPIRGFCDYEVIDGAYQITSNQCSPGCSPPPAPPYSNGDPTTVRVSCVAGG